MADEANLKTLDQISVINSIQIESWYQISEALKTPGISEFEIIIERDGKLLSKRVESVSYTHLTLPTNREV